MDVHNLRLRITCRASENKYMHAETQITTNDPENVKMHTRLLAPNY
jgi:hypothetical protein